MARRPGRQPRPARRGSAAASWTPAQTLMGVPACGVVAASLVAQTHFTYVVPATIVLVAGIAGWALAVGSVVLARVDGMSAMDDVALDRLDAQFGDLVRAGDVRVDIDAVRTDLEGDVTRLVEVLGAPGRTAAGLAETLAGWRSAGLVVVAASAAGDFAQWVELEGRSFADVHTLALVPPPASSVGSTC